MDSSPDNPGMLKPGGGLLSVGSVLLQHLVLIFQGFFMCSFVARYLKCVGISFEMNDQLQSLVIYT